MTSQKFTKYLRWLTKSGLLYVIKEGIIIFKYFNFDSESYSLFRQFKVVKGKKIRQQTCCLHVLPYSSPLPLLKSKVQLDPLRSISNENHNGGISQIHKFIFHFTNSQVHLPFYKFTSSFSISQIHKSIFLITSSTISEGPKFIRRRKSSLYL